MAEEVISQQMNDDEFFAMSMSQTRPTPPAMTLLEVLDTGMTIEEQ